MPSLFTKRLARGRPKRGRRNDKLLDITKAAMRLLAQKDFESWSMATLARDAGCSVGTLYARFSDKHSCLHYLINTTFRAITNAAKSELNAAASRRLAATAKVDLLVNHVVSAMTHPNAAGVIRATIKLATMHPTAIEDFEAYRKAISDCAITMLKDDLKESGSTEIIPVAVQVMLATITDAVLQKKPGPMSAGSGRMKSALANIVLGYIGIAKRSKWSGTEADDAESPVDNEVLDRPPNSGEALYDPAMGGFRQTKTRQSAKPKKTKAAPAGVTTVFRTPPKVPGPKAARTPPRPRRNRRVI